MPSITYLDVLVKEKVWGMEKIDNKIFLEHQIRVNTMVDYVGFF